MILAVLLLTVAIATVLAAFRFKRSSRVLYLVALVVFLFAGSGLPANWLLANLQDGLEVRNEQWGAANAIVLLGAGSAVTARSSADRSASTLGPTRWWA